MERKVLLLLRLLLTFITNFNVSNCESTPRHFRRHEYGTNQPQIFYPYFKTDCVCSRHWYYSFLQCEETFLLTYSSSFEELLNSTEYSIEKALEFSYHVSNVVPLASSFFNVKCDWAMALVCNKTIVSEDLNHDYPNFIGFNRSKSSYLYLVDCPEPSSSFVGQFFYPRNENFSVVSERNLIDNNKEMKNVIRVLHIKCLNRERFVITKNHLENLSNLEVFEVSCLVLQSLPSDLFQGTTPILRIVVIKDTRIDEIPSRLFYNLDKLEEVYLTNNLVKKIEGDAFLGCRHLTIVNLERNQLSHLEENLLDNFENITNLVLSRNSFTTMPKYFRKLSKLELLNLSQNRLQKIDEEHCEAFSNIDFLNVSYNALTDIHPNCFGSHLEFLDLSGNALKNGTENSIVLRFLISLFFNDNSRSHMNLKPFSTDLYLLRFYMRNSNVISIDNETLYGFPNLLYLDLSFNSISSVPENLFVRNTDIREINLRRNAISSIPSGLFRYNRRLLHLDLSWNKIKKLSGRLLSHYSQLRTLYLSSNQIENIPDNFLANAVTLLLLDLSNNSIASLKHDFLKKMERLYHLDLSDNRLTSIDEEILTPPNTILNITKLFLQGNNLSEFPWCALKYLQYLDLSRNSFSYVPHLDRECSTLPLKHLYLSKNSIVDFELFSNISSIENIETLDLSYNDLSETNEFHRNIRTWSSKLKNVDFSNNRFTSFKMLYLLFAKNLEKLNLSRSNINTFSWFKKNGDTLIIDKPIILPNTINPETVSNVFHFPTLKILDISDNNLSLTESLNIINGSLFTWGCLSPFHIFPNLEELILRNNSIASICVDWRTEMPRLKYLDLRDNKIPFLTHQDLLFKSTADESIGFGPYHWPHKLTIDLRHNQIRFVELPRRMLRVLPKKNETKGAYGHVEMLIDDNPLECGCALFNLLRVIRYDAVLTSQCKRVTGRNIMFPAALDVGNLSCSAPETVRGMKINNTEEWIHHLVPLFGLCSLQDSF